MSPRPSTTLLPAALVHGTHTIVLAVGVLTLLSTRPALAQDAHSRLDVLLQRISFNNAEKPETLGKELAELDSADLARLCDMLVEPGTGDDTKARMALHGMTWYVGSKGTQAQRDNYVEALCQALESEKPTAVKVFLVRQLELGGNERSVGVLAEFLSNGELYSPATQALVAISGEKAAAALRAALPEATGRNRVAIIDALGALCDQNAAGLLREDLTSEDEEVRFAAVAALANLGDKAINEALERATSGGDDTAYRSGQAQHLGLKLVAVSAARGDPELVQSLDGAFEDVDPAWKESHYFCALLSRYAEARGAPAVEAIVRALGSRNPEIRATAASIATRLQDDPVTQTILEHLRNAVPETRAAILNILARRGDESALPAALEALNDEDKGVRIAAVKTAAKLGREKAIDALVAFLDTEDSDEREAAEDALTGIWGDTVSGRIAAAVGSTTPRAQAALLDVLARRRARSQLETVLAFIENANEPVQVAAIKAVGVLADETASPRLLALLKQAESGPVREAIEAALADTCNRAESLDDRTAPIIAAIDTENVRDYCSLLRVLGHIGGKPTVRAFRDAIVDRREEVKETAIRAMGDWPDPTLLDTAFVLTVAHDAQELKHHVLAMRTFAEFLARAADEHIDVTVGLFVVGMDAARRDEERKLLLSKLASIHDLQVLDTLAGYLGDKALQAEAAAATISVAEALLPDYWSPARAALDKVLETAEAESIRSRAQEVLKRIAEYEDFITDWLVSGPYTEPGKDGKAVFDVAFPPELPELKDVEWKRQPITTVAEQYWYLDLTRSVGGDHCAAYLRTYVWSPTAQEVQLELGSDDGIKVWLNGEVIHANNLPRGCARGQDRVPTTLREGWNTLLLKVCNIGGGWGACARFRTREGGWLEGLRFDAKAQP